ncbi:MAG TPA: hypothetical protein VD927_10525 [Chryseosolibacter sp.]|nr:hypothetical protein [Chryseosolibacter sp.]
MRTVNISPDESAIYQTFQEGHPVQVRVTVSPGEEGDYQKGRTVRLVHEKGEAEGKIVSDPLEINSKADDGKMKTFSLVVEKP